MAAAYKHFTLADRRELAQLARQGRVESRPVATNHTYQWASKHYLVRVLLVAQNDATMG